VNVESSFAQPVTTAKHTSGVDAAPVGIVLIWAVNFSAVKFALEDLEPFALKSVRLIGDLREPHAGGRTCDRPSMDRANLSGRFNSSGRPRFF